MTDSYLHILVEAKKEYTGQLASILTSPMYEGISSIYKHAKTSSKDDNVLIKFQELLSKIPNWSSETLEREFQRIMLYSRCDWISDLITAVFISHTKVLSSIHLGQEHKEIELKVPTPLRFIHTVYVNIAREFWKNPYLMYDVDISSGEIQRNLRDAEHIIKNCIHESIRKLLPVRHIIREYLGENENQSIYTEDIKSTLSNVHIEQIKKMVEMDMQTMNIDNRPEDYTNHIENEADVESVLTINTVGTVPQKIELERSFNNYSTEKEVDNDNKVETDDNKEDKIDTFSETSEHVREKKSESGSTDKVSNFSILSKRLKLIRTHDRPVVKKNNRDAIF